MNTTMLTLSKTQQTKKNNSDILIFMGYEYIGPEDNRFIPLNGSNAGYYLHRDATPLKDGGYAYGDVLRRSNGTVPFNIDWNLLHKVMRYITDNDVLHAIPSFQRLTLRNKVQNAVWSGNKTEAYNALLEIIQHFNKTRYARPINE